MGLLDGNYEDERLTKKVKPAIQGGGYNYLGKQETVTVPKRWLSDPDHVVAELAYITPREAKVLLDLNLYGSLDGKPNNAPGGLPSLQGDMGSVGGGGSSGGGGNSGGGGGGGGGRDYSSVPASTPTTSTPSYSGGGGGQDMSSVPASKPSVGGNDNKIDPGFERALKEKAIDQQNPVYGDPDPEVDVDPQDRDSITSFKDNYIANVKSNPMYLGIGGLLHTAYQTGQAKSILSGVPGYEFLDYSDGNTPTVQSISEGGGDLLAASPYIVSGTTPVESQASKWYNSIGNDTKQFNFASAYATAKEKVSQTLNNKGPIGMLAVNNSPYYNWLKTNKLDKGIL